MNITFGRSASFLISGAVVAHTLWTSAAPAMTYPIYAREWHLSPAVTTGIFAIYPVVVVLVLILSGDISDYIGLRATMLSGLLFSIAGVLLFALGPNVVWIYGGRTLMGVGVGLSATPSAAAMVEFASLRGKSSASAAIAACQGVGLVAAALVGGALIQYAPYPTRSNFWVLFAVLSTIFAFTAGLPRHTPSEEKGPWKIRPVSVPKSLRPVFAVSAFAMSLSYALGAITLSLGAQIAIELVGSTNSLVNGAIIALFSSSSAVVSVAGRKLPPSLAILLGSIACILCGGFLVLSSLSHSLALFTSSMITAGIAYSMLFSGGLGLISAHAPAHHRGGAISALLLSAYLVQGCMAFVLGLLATAAGLTIAIEAGAAVLGVIAFATITLALATGPGRSSAY
ncbi:MFS transporter [Rhizobium jaguaris]|uniref:MFS transporter n=1 Tax=Rhizobium jaguaris TaxID=1312183 RepID=A0A387FQK2_9HYPH|nr:MFS transporter [Rhizobium jaguaris]AYG59957.1 MFS transporter [Rhizobium jaguaris]